jgi:BolA protein
MRIQESIERKITQSLTPAHLEVINESHMHNVPPGSESHFKVIVVTNEFDGVTRIRRHQRINGILEKELREDIHALSMRTLTPGEWSASGGKVTASPDCHGGSKNNP